MGNWSVSNLTAEDRRSSSSQSTVADLLLQIVDLGFLGSLFVAPLFFGGRHDLGRLIFVVFAGGTCLAWCLRQTVVAQPRWISSWTYLLGLGAVALLGVQLFPWPVDWINSLAPQTTVLLPLWNGGDGEVARFGPWQTLSFAPGATQIALATLLGYLMLFFTAVQRLQSGGDVVRLLRWIAIAAVAMCVFGLLQYFTSNGRFFWFYEYPFADTHRGVKGSFSCRNHFGHFLVLGIGPLVGWALSTPCVSRNSRRKYQNWMAVIDQRNMLFACVALVAFAVFLSLSRGAALTLVLTTGLLMCLYWQRGLISNKAAWSQAGIAIAVVGMLSIYGFDDVARRLDDLTKLSIDEMDAHEGRRKIWRANFAAIQAGGLFGSGAGSHIDINHAYLDEPAIREYTHAESGYLQVTTENGLLGGGLLVAFIAAVTTWCYRALRSAKSTEDYILAGAVTAGLAASAVQSLFDFVWYVPACLTMALLLAACALRFAQMGHGNAGKASKVRTAHRAHWVGFAVLTAGCLAWCCSVLVGPARASLHWDRYLLSSIANTRPEKESIELLYRASEDKPNATINPLDDGEVYHLLNTLARNPRAHHAHLLLAGKYLASFDALQSRSENAMTVEQVRDAAMDSRFASAEELRAWLTAAFGENCNLLYRAYAHTQIALRLCPLQGDGYVYLAKLCFLDGSSSEAIIHYLEQGVRVRPQDTELVFEAARQNFLVGNTEHALEEWKRIFAFPGLHQHQVVHLLAGRIPAETFLELFEPDWRTLWHVWERYRQVDAFEDCEVIARYATVAAQELNPNLSRHAIAKAWVDLARMQHDLGQQGAELESLRNAYAVSPSNYTVRIMLGQLLVDMGQYREAESHLKWCLNRQPNQARVKSLLATATRNQLQAERSIYTSPGR